MTVLKIFEVLLYYHFLLKMKQKNELTHQHTLKLSCVHKNNALYYPFQIFYSVTHYHFLLLDKAVNIVLFG